MFVAWRIQGLPSQGEAFERIARKTADSSRIWIRMCKDAIEFVLHRTFTARVVCHHHLHWERRIGDSATSSRPSAFRIFCLALEKMVSTATTVRFWCRAIS